MNAVSAALDTVITSGAYHEVLENYGLNSSAITDARVNFGAIRRTTYADH